MTNITALKNIRPVFSGHETFPMRYGWLKKVYDASIALEKKNKNSSITKDLFNKDEAIVTLGVGKNMVSSMKHWSIYTSLFDVDKDKNLSLNNFARWIFDDAQGVDPWLENYATLWYLHWSLVRLRENDNNLFTYLWFFNQWNGNTFDKDTLKNRITEVLRNFRLKEPSVATLKRDIECFLGVYAPKAGKNKSNEERIESPLTELELISPITRRDLFQVNRGMKPSLSMHTFLFGLFMFWQFYSPSARTLSFESVCYEFMSPGRIFLLSEDAIASYMQSLIKETDGMLEYTETAGMKQIILNKNINFEKEAFRYFKRNYK